MPTHSHGTICDSREGGGRQHLTLCTSVAAAASQQGGLRVRGCVVRAGAAQGRACGAFLRRGSAQGCSGRRSWRQRNPSWAPSARLAACTLGTYCPLLQPRSSTLRHCSTGPPPPPPSLCGPSIMPDMVAALAGTAAGALTFGEILLSEFPAGSQQRCRRLPVGCACLKGHMPCAYCFRGFRPCDSRIVPCFRRHAGTASDDAFGPLCVCIAQQCTPTID